MSGSGLPLAKAVGLGRRHGRRALYRGGVDGAVAFVDPFCCRLFPDLFFTSSTVQYEYRLSFARNEKVLLRRVDFSISYFILLPLAQTDLFATCLCVCGSYTRSGGADGAPSI